MKNGKLLSIVLACISLLLAGALIWSLVSNHAALKQKDTELESLRMEKTALESAKAENASELAALKTASEAEIAELTAERDSLISDYKRYKNIISQDEVEQTLFGQPISTERDGEYRMGIKTAIDGDYHATLTIYQAQGGKYVEVFSCEALVGKNGPGKQSEGDVKTPLGTWTIGEAYGIKEDPGCKVPFTQITDDMYWCATGSNGLKYNTLLYKSDDPDNDYSEDEHLIDYPIRYAYLLDLGYNAPGAPYAGNAIFLHCWKEPDYPTGGCVAVSEESMIEILRIVTPGTSVTIY